MPGRGAPSRPVQAVGHDVSLKRQLSFYQPTSLPRAADGAQSPARNPYEGNFIRERPRRRGSLPRSAGTGCGFRGGGNYLFPDAVSIGAPNHRIGGPHHHPIRRRANRFPWPVRRRRPQSHGKKHLKRARAGAGSGPRIGGIVGPGTQGSVNFPRRAGSSRHEESIYRGPRVADAFQISRSKPFAVMAFIAGPTTKCRSTAFSVFCGLLEAGLLEPRKEQACREVLAWATPLRGFFR